MTRFPTTTLTKTAAFLATVMIAAVVAPIGALAANEAGSPDGLVVYVKPRGGVGEDNVLLTAINGMYIFDFQLFDAEGNAFETVDYAIDLNSIDPERPENPDFSGAALVYTKRFESATPVSSGTIRVPATELGYFTSPIDGLALTLIVYRDGAGNSLVVDGHAPAGQFSVPANLAVEAGDFGSADQLDEGLTPLLVDSGQLSGLLLPGNPVLNPGFEAGSSEVDTPQNPAGFSTALPPWFLMNLAGDDENRVPASTHFLAGQSTAGGSYASIHYDDADAGKGLAFGQFFSPPGNEPGVWVAGSSLKLSFDARQANNYGYHGCATIHWLPATPGSAEQQATQCLVNPLTEGSYQFTHITYDFGNVAAGGTLTSVFFSLVGNWPDGAIIAFDNVKIQGAAFRAGSLSLENDLTDGFSTFIFPQHPTVGSSTQGVAASRLQLGDGSLGYVFEVAAMDYTSNMAETVDLAGKPAVFQLLDQNYLTLGLQNQDLSHAPEDVLFSTTTAYRFLDSENTVSERRLVVVPVGALGTTSAVVPWFWVDMGPQAPEYYGTFGLQADPASAYYSVYRNNLMSTSLADQLDYAFTPLALRDVLAATVPAVELDIECPAAGPGTFCAQDSTPTIEVSVSSASRVLETLPVTLVSAADEDIVLGTATADLPADTVSFTLTTEQLDALGAAGDMRVKAIVGDGVFTEGGETDALRLNNIVPDVDFTITPATDLVKGSVVTLTAVIVDDKPVSADAVEWNVTFISDATPEGDSDFAPADAYQTKEGLVVTYVVPDDGSYEVVLTVTDADGEDETAQGAFTAANRVPVGLVAAPAYGQKEMPIVFTFVGDDPDDFVQSVDWDMDGDGTFEVVDGTDAQSATFAADGAKTVSARAHDTEGGVATFTHTILIDSVGPTTAIAVGTIAPASGWYTGDVVLTFTREDDASGIDSTLVAGIGDVEEVEGSASFSRNVTGDGVHTILAKSKDLAGNSGPEVTTTIKIDTTAPELGFVRTNDILPFEPVVASEETVVEATASDTASGVVKVVFQIYAEGHEVIFVEDVDGTDGWQAVFDSSTMSGVVQVDALAQDAAGHVAESSESLTLFVFGAPALPSLE